MYKALLFSTLLIFSSQAAYADGAKCETPPAFQLSDFVPGMKPLDSPFMGTALQNDRLFERAEACTKRGAKDADGRAIETEAMTAARVKGTELEPFTSEVNAAMNSGQSDVATYSAIARIMSAARIISAYERFSEKSLTVLPAACSGKLEQGLKRVHASRSSGPKSDPNFSEKFKIGAQQVRALMGEQAFYKELVEKRRAAKAGVDNDCDRFVLGTPAHPMCPEDRLHEIESTIEGYYSAYPQLGMGRNFSKPAYEEAPRMEAITKMNLDQLEANLKTANAYVAEKLDAALAQVCGDGSIMGLPARDLLNTPSVREAGVWKTGFPEFSRTRTCVEGELKEESALLKRSEKSMALGCGLADFVALGLVSPVCAGDAAFRHLQESSKKLTWLSRCRAGGDALCEGEEAMKAQHANEDSHRALKEAKIDFGVAAITAAATMGLMKASMPKVPVTEGLSFRMSEGIANLSVKNPELSARLAAIQNTMTATEAAAIEEAHLLPNGDLAGKVAILRAKAPRLQMLDRRALIEGWVAGDKDVVVETTFWKKIDCDTCGTKDQVARPDKNGIIKCATCGNNLNAKKSIANFNTDAVTNEIVGAEAQVAKTPHEVAMAKSGPDKECPFCKVANKGLNKVCENCGGSFEKPQAPQAPVVEHHTPHQPAPKPKGNGKLIAAGVAAAGVAVVGGVVVYEQFIKAHDVTGDVKSAHWRRTTPVQRFTPVTLRAIKADIPAGSSRMPRGGSGEYVGSSHVRNCKVEFIKDEDYPCGTEEKCEMVAHIIKDPEVCDMVPKEDFDKVPDGEFCPPKKCEKPKDNGNGSVTQKCVTPACVPKFKKIPKTTLAKECTHPTHIDKVKECQEVPKTCTRPINKERCDYDTYVWKDLSPIVKEGDLTAKSKNLSLPERSDFHLDDLTRTQTPKDEFTVDIDFKAPDGTDKHYTLKPETSQEFSQWHKGTSANVSATRHGDVQSVTPKP